MANFANKMRQTRAKFLGAYYGNPIRDMKLVCVTGSTGRAIVARLVHEILNAAGQHVAILATDAEVKAGMLHKFFSEAWKAGANYVIVSTPTESINKSVFHGLPVSVAAVTDYVSSTLDSLSSEEYVKAVKTLLGSEPDYVVLNSDDVKYPDFATFTGKKNTYTFGHNPEATLRVSSSRLYKRGVEASFGIGSSYFTCATFLTGEIAVEYMACAAAIATALSVGSQAIVEGMANFDPDEKGESEA